MVFTRQEAKAAFQHVLDNVLGKDDSSPLKQAIVAEGFEDVFTMMMMDDTIIDTLVYDKSPTEINVAVSRGEKTLAKGIQAYVRYLIANGNPLSEAAEWMALTQQDFDLFRVKMTPVGMTTVGPLNPAGNQAMSAGTGNPNTHRYTPADNFHRGIKRDTNLIEVLKEEKFNDTWHRTFYTQARAQDLMEVLDAAYVPTTQEEKDLFNEKQKYVYAVLEMKVFTDRGKGFIREHENNYDAQKAYIKPINHHLKFIKAMTVDSHSVLLWHDTRPLESTVLQLYDAFKYLGRRASSLFSEDSQKLLGVNFNTPVSFFSYKLAFFCSISNRHVVLHTKRRGVLVRFKHDYTSHKRLLLITSVARDKQDFTIDECQLPMTSVTYTSTFERSVHFYEQHYLVYNGATAGYDCSSSYVLINDRPSPAASVMSTDTEQRAPSVSISDWAQMTMTSRSDHGKLSRVLPTVRMLPLGCHVTLTARSIHGELSKDLPAVLGCHVTLSARSIHGELSKVLHTVRSLSRGDHVNMTHCVDANLMHCVTMERQVPDWFVIPVHDKPYMFGDKESVTIRSMRVVHMKKHKHCNMMAHWRDKLLEWEQLKSVFFW